MPWELPNPNITNDPSYLDPRLSNVESVQSDHTTSLAQIAYQAKNNGVVPDGTTDNTTALQNLLNSLSNGGTILLSSGSNLINTITIPYDNITIVGTGDNCEIYSNNVSLVIDLTNRKNITFKNFKIRGNFSNKTAKLTKLNNTDNILFENVTFQDIGNVAVYNDVNTTVTNTTIKNCKFKNTGDFGINFQGGDNIKVVQNYFYGNSYVNYPPHAIYLKYDITNSVVANNVIENCQGAQAYGIKISGETNLQAKNNVVSGNTVSNSYGGVWIVECQDLSVMGNVVKDLLTPDSSVPSGICFNLNNTNITINANTIDSGVGYGVYSEYLNDGNYTKNVAINGNYIDCVNGSILFKNGKTIMINGNVLKCHLSTTNYTVFIESNSQDVQIIGNNIERGDRAIMLYQSTLVTVANNTIRDSSTSTLNGSGIIVDASCSASMVVGNNMNASTGNISVNGINNMNYGNFEKNYSRKLLYAGGIPTSGSFTQADKIYNLYPVGGGTEGWICTTTGTANNTAWAATTAYTVGQQVNAGGNVYQCTTAGTSGSTAPTGTGTSITDGTVVWQYVSALAVFKTFGNIGA